jgi:hypothetical protein
MINRLPLELYRPICENSDRSSLLKLATVSPSFQIEAERLIYQRVFLGSSLFQGYTCCNHLLRAPRFLDYVQFLVISDLTWGDDALDELYGDSWGAHITDRLAFFVELVASLLARLPNLLALRISAPHHLAETSYRLCEALAQRSTCRLRTLGCNFVTSPGFLSFLINQTSIRELEWSAPPGNVGIDIAFQRRA